VLGEVLQPGDRVLVAKGGKGGSGLVAPSRLQKQRDLSKEFKQAQVRHESVSSSQSGANGVCAGSS
jgi:hypothetical protein